MSRCQHGFELTVVNCTICPSPHRPVSTQNRRGAVADLSGQQFAGVTVVARVANAPDGEATWHCDLDCGHSKRVRGTKLRELDARGGRVRCAEGCGANERRSR